MRARATSCSSRSLRPCRGGAASRRTSESSEVVSRRTRSSAAGEPITPLGADEAASARWSRPLKRQSTHGRTRLSILGRRAVRNSTMDNLPRYNLRRSSCESWRSSEDLDQLKNAVAEIVRERAPSAHLNI
eukprot:6255489-Prymnesium_polylepis.1